MYGGGQRSLAYSQGAVPLAVPSGFHGQQSPEQALRLWGRGQGYYGPLPPGGHRGGEGGKRGGLWYLPHRLQDPGRASGVGDHSQQGSSPGFRLMCQGHPHKRDLQKPGVCGGWEQQCKEGDFWVLRENSKGIPPGAGGNVEKRVQFLGHQQLWRQPGKGRVPAVFK